MKHTFGRLTTLLALTLSLTSLVLAQQPELVVDTDHADSFSAFAFSPDGKVFATVNGDNAIRLWASASGKNIATLKGPEARITTIAFSGTHISSGDENRTVRIWEVQSGRVVMSSFAHNASITQVAFSPGGKYLVSSGLDDTVKIWDTFTGRELRTFTAQKEGVTAVTVSPDGKLVAKGGHNGIVNIFNIETTARIKSLQVHQREVTAIAFSPDGKFIASASADETIKVWPIDFSSPGVTLRGVAKRVTSLAFSRDGRGIISGSFGSSSDWESVSLVFSLTPLPDSAKPATNTKTRELCKVYSFRDNSWAVLDAEGRYDASYGGEIPWLKWKIGSKLVALNQLKAAYYQPGLLAILLGLSEEQLSPIIKLTEVQPYPDVVFAAPEAGSTQLNIKLTNGGGGIGRVQVKLNNTEVYEDARGSSFDPKQAAATLKLDLAGPALMPGKPNQIQVVAWNADGYLSSPTENMVTWTPANLEPDNSPPEFYAIVIGTSEYSDPSIKLRYAARDAESIARALDIGARRLFAGAGRVEGKGRVHITLLRTSDDSKTLPSKKNITTAFEDVRQSKPQDVLVIYMSGHGVVLRSGNLSRQNDLYSYLTKEARSKSPEAFILPDLIRNATVTSEEMAGWIKEIPAQRRVLILDTCGAGAAAADLSLKGEGSSFYQIKALDKLKDRTGFFVLMGSASNSVSWEASAYGQGLLTYALLTKMKSADPNKDETEVDVADLFRFAADTVPQLALGLGGVQQPEIIIPQGSASFPIGLLSVKDKKDIPLQMKKPIVLSPRLLDREDGTDELDLTRALSKGLDQETYTRAKGSTFESEIVYVEASELPGAYVPTGTYVVQGETVKVDLVLSRDGVKTRFSVSGSKDNLPELVTTIVTRIMENVNSTKE